MVFNVPNAITAARALLIPVFLYLVVQNNMFLATIVFLVFSLLDGIDGLLARLLKQETVFGKSFDMLTDNAFGLSSMFVFLFVGLFPSGLFLVILFLSVIKAALIFIALIKTGSVKKSVLRKINGSVLYLYALSFLLGYGVQASYVVVPYYAVSILVYFIELRRARVF